MPDTNVHMAYAEIYLIHNLIEQEKLLLKHQLMNLKTFIIANDSLFSLSLNELSDKFNYSHQNISILLVSILK